MWPRVNDKMGSSNENILCSPCFLFKKYEPSQPMNSPSVTSCTLIFVSLTFHLIRRFSVLGWLGTQVTNVLLLVEETPTCEADISVAF